MRTRRAILLLERAMPAVAGMARSNSKKEA